MAFTLHDQNNVHLFFFSLRKNATPLFILISSALLAGLAFHVWGNVGRTGGGTSTASDPIFEDEWEIENLQWVNEGKGLQLTIRNSLSDNYDKHFDKAVEDWNAAPSLSLMPVNSNKVVASNCFRVDGIIRACNGEYGDTQWLGLNEALYYDGGDGNNYIVSSLVKINDTYLKDASDAKKQYVMCHEMG